MASRNRRRTTERFAIDADLLRELRSEATANGIPLERYVEQILAVRLPAIIAQKMTDYVTRSIQLANNHDTLTAIDPREESS